MATSGEEITSILTTPDSEINSDETVCSPCQSDGKSIAVIGYCETCKASLCKLCFECHTIPVPMRNHQLLKREQTGVEHEGVKDKSRCPKHKEETVLYHCPAHSFLGCHTCFFQHQKSCREAQYIPDIAQTFASSDEFKAFMTELEHVAEISKNLFNESKQNITLAQKCHTDAIAAVKAFKIELLESIDQLERDLNDIAEEFKQKEISKLTPVVDHCQQVQTEIQGIATEIEVLQNTNRSSDLYISMIKSKSKLLSLDSELNTIKDENMVKLFKFRANAKLRETLKRRSSLGTLRKTPDVFTAEYITDISVHLNDKNICSITGSVTIPENKLVIADYNNKDLKVIDTNKETVLSAITMSSAPWSLAKVTDNTVVATLPHEKKVLFITINPALSIDDKIGVNGACYGVAYSDGKLVVGFFNPHKVEIMDLKGSVSSTIQTGGNGHALFNWPYYIAINHEGSLIYVSNWNSHNVVCLRFDGTVVATYEDNELQYPRQVIVDSTGNVYVCAEGSNNVHHITEECKKINVLLTSADGLSYPHTISYEEAGGKFYVGQWNNANVKVYQLTNADL